MYKIYSCLAIIFFMSLIVSHINYTMMKADMLKQIKENQTKRNQAQEAVSNESRLVADKEYPSLIVGVPEENSVALFKQHILFLDQVHNQVTNPCFEVACHQVKSAVLCFYFIHEESIQIDMLLLLDTGETISINLGFVYFIEDGVITIFRLYSSEQEQKLFLTLCSHLCNIPEYQSCSNKQLTSTIHLERIK